MPFERDRTCNLTPSIRIFCCMCILRLGLIYILASRDGGEAWTRSVTLFVTLKPKPKPTSDIFGPASFKRRFFFLFFSNRNASPSNPTRGDKITIGFWLVICFVPPNARSHRPISIHLFESFLTASYFLFSSPLRMKMS